MIAAQMDVVGLSSYKQKETPLKGGAGMVSTKSI